ncbi:MAG TPA: vitamin K epoxide reductase family protein [Gemmatimonadales bacterium]
MLALIGFFLSLYLWLWKTGVLGTLACGSGSCDFVQLSEYGELFGQPVALYGVIGYLGLFATGLWGLQGRWVARREPTVVLAVLSGLGVAFTAYLTYLEAAVLHAWCRWCLISAAIIVAIFASAVAGLWSTRTVSPPAGSR